MDILRPDRDISNADWLRPYMQDFVKLTKEQQAQILLSPTNEHKRMIEEFTKNAEK